MTIDIQALARLARLELSDAERAELEVSVPKILSFVDTIQSIDVDAGAHEPVLKNVLRADVNPHEGGIYTDDLLRAAPARVDDRIAVKQVISRKQK